MSGISQGAIMGGIGQGINQASANILNLYGMKQKMDLQQQQMDINKQNADSYSKMLQYNFVSQAEHTWKSPQVRQPMPGRGTDQPGRMNFGLPAQLETDPAYMQPDANAFFDPNIGG